MGTHSDDLRGVGDNPTGAGDIPVVSLDQIENIGRPGGRSPVTAGAGEGPDFVSSPARPGAQEGGAKSASSIERFGRPGGSEDWK